jgi:hypothetical protein
MKKEIVPEPNQPKKRNGPGGHIGRGATSATSLDRESPSGVPTRK